MDADHLARDIAVADILDGTALYLEWHGWTQEYYLALAIDDDPIFPPACVSGAIHIVVTGTTAWEDGDYPFTPDEVRDIDAALDAVALWVNPTDYLSTDGGFPDPIVIGWNDSPKTTADTVIRELRAIAIDNREHRHYGTRIAGYIRTYLAHSADPSTTDAPATTQ